jgi:hypothetical protein
MIEAKFKDIYGTQIEIQESCSGYFRMDFKGKQFLEPEDKVSGHKIPCCVSLTENQARVLLSCLNSYFTLDE